MKKIFCVLGMILLLVVGTVACGKAEENATEEGQETNLAPDFTVYDMEGNAVSLSDFRGKPVVLNFWASWCGPCRSEMPDFQKIYEEYKEDVVFLMVNLTDGSQETVETVTSFIEKSGYTFPVYVDTDLDAARAYSVNSVPRTYFINAEGKSVAKAKTAINEEVILKGLNMILGE